MTTWCIWRHLISFDLIEAKHSTEVQINRAKTGITQLYRLIDDSIMIVGSAVVIMTYGNKTMTQPYFP